MHLRHEAARFALVAIAACGGSAAPQPGTPSAPAGAQAPAGGGAATPASTKEPIATGKDCAKAVADCGSGVCKIALQNDCAQPVTCDAAAIATCKQSTEMIQADGRNRDTFAAHSKGELDVTANCTQGEILHTELKSISCR